MVPSIGLICTSIGFFIPAWIAKKRQRKSDALAISTLAGSSLLYHGTLHPCALAFDKLVAHSVAIHYLLSGMRRVVKRRAKRDVIGLLFAGISTGLYYRKSLPTKDERVSRKWHMGVHVSAQLALVLGLPPDNLTL